jgi:hypothetical protein
MLAVNEKRNEKKEDVRNAFPESGRAIQEDVS